jgi:hypothetical protein
MPAAERMPRVAPLMAAPASARPLTLPWPRRRLMLLAPALLASGCLSIPVSTMWKLRGFGVDEFFALDPAQLRGAVRTDTRARYEAVVIDIDIKLQGQPPARHALELRSLQAGDARLEPAPPGRRWYVFALGPQGEAVFHDLRRRLATIKRDGSNEIRIGIGARSAEVPPDLARALPMRLDLLLDPREGYVTLFKETIVDTTAARERKA